MTKSIFVIVFLTFYGCSQSEKNSKSSSTEEVRTPTYNATEIASKLNEAYLLHSDKNNLDSLSHFFREWNSTVGSNTDKFIGQNDTLKAIYEVFKTIYIPFDLLKLGNWEVGDTLYSDSTYVVVQNKIYYGVLNTDTFSMFYPMKSKDDSISDFRPPVVIPRSKVLYLVGEYDSALNAFLSKASETLHKETTNKKAEVVRKFIPIIGDHMGVSWHFETHPKIESIIFNKSLNQAIVEFRVRYQGGTAKMQKANSGWRIVSSRVTWIE